MKHLNALNIIFFASVFLVILIALAVIPRQAAFLILGMYLIFVLLKPVEESALLFVGSIPFFIALPLTANFDNFNTWRIVSLVIFLKWFFTASKYKLNANIRLPNVKEFWRHHKIEVFGIILFFLAFLSLFFAPDFSAGAKRVIYFLNLILIFIVVRNLIGRNKELVIPFAKNITLGAAAALALGYLQFFSTYFIPIDTWYQWWGRQIALNLYGHSWSDIVMRGNTWFSYTGGSLKLRMFSIFPDSHSFPLYLLMAMPAVITAAFYQFRNKIALFWNKNYMEQIKGKISILRRERRSGDWLIFIVLISLALILSGTRGIWVSIIFPALFAIFFYARYKNWRQWIYPMGKLILIFLILLPIASLIWTVPQFQMGQTVNEPGREAFIKRIQSSFDVGETSNTGRIFIWKETLKSLVKNPIFGVGIGNFPAVLEQDVDLAKAGSSAHNLYLNIAAEIGLIALAAFLLLLLEILKNAWLIFKKFDEPHLKIFGLASIVFLLWVFGYSLTDAALFDERAFLIFMALTGIITGLKINLTKK